MQLQSNRFPLKDSDYLNRQVINNIPITNAIPQKIIKTSKIDKILLLTTRTEVNIDELSPQNRILELMNQNISLGECEKEIKSLINSLSIKTLHVYYFKKLPLNNKL